MQWSKHIPFTETREGREEWSVSKEGGEKTFSVHVTRGKKVDILGLKLHEQETFRTLAEKLKKDRVSLFGSANVVAVTSCPVCSHTAKDAQTVFEVDGAMYVQCLVCTHVFLNRRRDDALVQEHYKKDAAYHATYIDKRNALLRVEQVATPKAEWVLKRFREQYGREPKKILDVGAGAGHFVRACRSLGIEADGVEISDVARVFCKEYFDIELINKDFLKEKGRFKGEYDLITFWGVIEHVPEPLDMLSVAREILPAAGGLVVTSVPNWSSLSTVVQQHFKDTIIRHLHPLEHIQCFTEESVATAYVRAGLDITAAWYFGMDAYELLTQLAYRGGTLATLASLAPLMNDLQNRIDLSGISDEVVLAGSFPHD